MKKIYLQFLILFFGLFLNIKLCSAGQPTHLYIFYDSTCPYCEQARAFIGNLKKDYPELQIKPFEVIYNEKNRQLYFAFGKAYGLDLTETPIPAIFIGEKAFNSFNDSIGANIKQTVIKCVSKGCANPIDKIEFSNNAQNEIDTNLKQNKIATVIAIAAAFFIFFLSIKKISKKSKNK